MLSVAACIVLLVLLIVWAKVNPFLAFLLVSVLAGWLLGIPLIKIGQSIQKGVGDTLGSLVLIIALGAMLGKLVAESGAAQKIASVMMGLFGEKYIHWGLVCTGFIIGIPLFYGVGFVLMVPLIFSVVYQYRLPAVAIGLPMLASLSVAHGFLPPHPSPAALVGQFHGDMGLTLVYGLIIAVPTIILAGPVYALTLKGIHSEPLVTFQASFIPEEELPSGFSSFFTALLPVGLLTLTTLSHFYPGNPFEGVLGFIGDPTIVMLISVIVATFTLGISRGKSMTGVMKTYETAVKDIAMIVLISGGAGALKQVLTDSGLSTEIANQLQSLEMPPLFLGWLIAAIIRVCIGSATVAGLTAAGIIAPLMTQQAINPNLMVLSIGAGSLMFSHVNDPGFWMFKEYFNLSVKDTIRSWSMMETLVAIVGLLGVLLLNQII
ncbi:gluconate:H+ symporter [Siphonobacter sp. SORGH_AS_1065]|uniref:gluconate:H+ symporter n=1 Tax=Siphonobacter sp. SORGH_AS_1065 TaxID=3041795 RepID=UPI002784CBF8|nr:gluconate:H+ symporter [Siphonobacter sp. SORGH_AS_1065]MDQ1086070.1 Gnt-I system high-affinity gluconate transporter [Siphonobacter sp. SORGH_AS_1065]